MRKMVDIKKIVSDELIRTNASTDSLKLWEDLFSLYSQGGPEAMESYVEEKIKGIKSALRIEKKAVKEVAPKIKKPKRKKRS